MLDAAGEVVAAFDRVLTQTDLTEYTFALDLPSDIACRLRITYTAGTFLLDEVHALPSEDL